MVRLLSATFVALLAIASAPASFAQGLQTGSIRGVVKDSTGQVVPQVTVRAVSQSQHGSRETVSDDIGAYQLQGLTPGQSTVTYEFSGCQTVTAHPRLGVSASNR